MPPPWKMFSESTIARPVEGDGTVDLAVKSSNSNYDSPLQSSNSFQRNLQERSNVGRSVVGRSETKGQASNQVKVSFWPSSATEDDLRDLFSAFGEVIRARILPPIDGRDITLCFISFSSADEAETTVCELNKFEVNGKRIRVEIDTKSMSNNEKRQTISIESSSCQVKVFSWPASLNEEDLKMLFSTVGEVKRVCVLPVREGRYSSLAYVTFECHDSAKIAVSQYNGHEIEGKRLNVQLDDKGSTTSQRPERREVKMENKDAYGGGNEIKILSCPLSVSEEGLKELLGSVGLVKQVKILPAREGRDITLAFATFGSKSDAAAAAEKYDGFDLMGKKLKVLLNKSNWHSKSSCSYRKNESPEIESNPISVKPWGSLGRERSGHSPNSSFSKGMQETLPGRGSTLNEPQDGEMFMKRVEKNRDFSSISTKQPVVYIPAPPPESEFDIFRDTRHQGINFQNYENIPVEVSGRDPPTKIDSFNDAKLHSICMQNIARANYSVPTPIQKHALPVILNGRDVMACAQTGSGKTAAYLLPMLSNLLSSDAKEAGIGEVAYPSALIIAPTRELAVQIFLEARKFSYGSNLQTVVVYGGVSIAHQLGKLYDGCDILVATPGRLSDFIARGRISLSNIQYMVLDEADRMLDMGFGPTVKGIMESNDIPSKTVMHKLMLSATFPEIIQELAGSYLNDYIFVTVGLVGGASTDIMQRIVEVPGSEKRAKLEEILLESDGDRILVFVETKRSADFLASFLSQRNFPTTSISSDRSQEERECALKDFRSGKAPVLIATAVAARGLDIPDVKQVINFDLPSDIDEYVHRIGRTGRIGNHGRAIAFFDRLKDQKIARGLIKVLSKSGQDVPDWLEEIAMSAIGTNYGPGGGQFSSRDTRNNQKTNQHETNGLGNGRRFHTVNKFEQEKEKLQSNDVITNDVGDDEMWC